MAITAVGQAARAPDAEDCPNFVWWCDSGAAAWTGSRQPGKAPAATYPAAFLGTLQAVHLLARAEDVAKSQWDPKFHKKRQEGTVVYRGVVYDHIHYRNSGQASAHAGGKNKWVIKFNRGHDLPFADHHGVAPERPALSPGQAIHSRLPYSNRETAEDPPGAAHVNLCNIPSFRV